ncbi:MAG: VanZ family protein [bacterium]|jgi:glycopeptide antibiotics resistance protein
MKEKWSGRRAGKTLLWLLFILYLAWLARLTVFRYPPALLWRQMLGIDATALRLRLMYGCNLVPLRTISAYLFRATNMAVARVNLIGNVAVFVPFGFVAPLLLPSLTGKRLAAAAAAGSLGLELAQFVTGAGSFDVDDILLNTLGAGIGFTVYKLWRRLATAEENRTEQAPEKDAGL